ncbi:hypothetical protein Tco_1350761 [Tanacetum coccineum]
MESRPIHDQHVPYRIWEEFVQSIQTFLTNRKNLITASRGKKKTAHLLIPSVRFTKLIIHHLKTKHNIHPRTGSPLHYSHDENVLNTLGFVGKDGREIFGMPIPDALLTDDIKGAPYYDEYLEHVAKYQQHLDAEHGIENEGGATESPKATKVTKPKAAKVTKLAGDKAPKPTSSQPPKPTPAQTEPSKKYQGKKRKMVKETSDAPSPAKRAKAGKMRTPMPIESSRHAESPSLDTELALTDSEMESDEEAPEIHAGDQDEGQAGPNLVEQDEGQAGLNLGDAAESQPQSSYVVHAGPNLKHMDSEVINASTQQNPEQMDEEFTTTAFLNVQENLKLPTEDQVIIKEPASSTRTLQLSTGGKVGQTWVMTVQIGKSKYFQAEDLDEAHKKKRKRRESPRTPPGSLHSQPPPPAGASGAPGTSGASGSSQLPPPPHPPSTDVENNWASAFVSTYEPLAENSLLAKIGDMTTFMIWYCQKVNKIVLTQADFEGQAYEFVKAFYPDVIHL